MAKNYHTKLKRKAFERDNYICQLNIHPECKGDMRQAWNDWKLKRITRRRVGISVDHKQPLSRGGKWELSNMVTACVPCNQLKGNKTEAELAELLASE